MSTTADVAELERQHALMLDGVKALRNSAQILRELGGKHKADADCADEAARETEAEAAALSAQIAAAKSPPKSRWEERIKTITTVAETLCARCARVHGSTIYVPTLADELADALREAVTIIAELSAAAESGNFTEENVVKALMMMTPDERHRFADSASAQEIASLLVSAFHRTKGVGNGK